jgi:hypothetical protein
MTRWIDLFTFEGGGKNYVSGYAWSVGLGEGAHPNDQSDGGLKIGGCGMDMGFALVYALGRKLYPDGFDCAGERCPSNDHCNRVEATHHKDGGYALRHAWI